MLGGGGYAADWEDDGIDAEDFVLLGGRRGVRKFDLACCVLGASGV